MFIEYLPTKKQLTAVFDAYKSLYNFYTLTDTFDEQLTLNFDKHLSIISNNTNPIITKNKAGPFILLNNRPHTIKTENKHYQLDQFKLPTYASRQTFLYIVSLSLLKFSDIYHPNNIPVSLSTIYFIIINNIKITGIYLPVVDGFKKQISILEKIML